MFIGDDEQSLVGDMRLRNGIELPPGEKFVIDIDHVRNVALDLRDILLAGDPGDSVSVVYLEEENGED